MFCGLIQDNVLVDKKELSADQFESLSHFYQAIIDISGMMPEPEVGWTFDGINLNGPVTTMKITRLAFRNRFTMAEKATLYTAASTPQGIGLKVYLDDLAAASFVDLARPDTKASVNYLASIGILTSARAAEILNTMPTAIEIYKGN